MNYKKAMLVGCSILSFGLISCSKPVHQYPKNPAKTERRHDSSNKDSAYSFAFGGNKYYMESAPPECREKPAIVLSMKGQSEEIIHALQNQLKSDNECLAFHPAYKNPDKKDMSGIAACIRKGPCDELDTVTLRFPTEDGKYRVIKFSKKAKRI